MAIVIDAERPHACWACDYRCGLNIIARTEEEGIADDCPIIGEIPDVHGDLIDRDYVKKNQISLNDAPTVLEATE